LNKKAECFAPLNRVASTMIYNESSGLLKLFVAVILLIFVLLVQL